MTYSVINNEDLTKVRCDQCEKFVEIGKIIEQYDTMVEITGWDNKPAHPLKTFCSVACKDKYFGENQ